MQVYSLRLRSSSRGPGEKGHLFSVIVTPTSVAIMEHNDKAKPESKNKQHAVEKVKLDPDKTYTLIVECKGTKVAAQIVDVATIQAEAEDFKVKKPGLVFRVAGEDTAQATFDNLHVWEIK